MVMMMMIPVVGNGDNETGGCGVDGDGCDEDDGYNDDGDLHTPCIHSH